MSETPRHLGVIGQCLRATVSGSVYLFSALFIASSVRDNCITVLQHCLGKDCWQNFDGCISCIAPRQIQYKLHELNTHGAEGSNG